MDFEWLGLLGEYLFPLLVLVPLAIVVVILAARSHRSDHWDDRRNEALRPRDAANASRRTRAPTAPPVVRPTPPVVRPAPPVMAPPPPREPVARQPLPPVPSSAALAPKEPVAPTPVVMQPGSPTAYSPTEPAPLGPPILPKVVAAPPTISLAPSTGSLIEGAAALLHTPDSPATAAPVTPFLSPNADALAPAEPLREVTIEDRRGEAPPDMVMRRRRASDRMPGPPAPSSGPMPVLIVDDSAVVRAKLGKLLTSNGYAVTAARHGVEALEQLNQQWFSLMITDLEMPEMDGFELIQHVSGDIRTENLPIVAITGHEALQAKVHDAKGLYGIFKKPWNDREMLQRVAALTLLRPRV